MIKLLHAITLDRLQNKAIPSVTHTDANVPSSSPLSTDVPSSSAEQVVESAPPSAMPPPPQPGPSVQKPIDFGELKLRLENAYRTPTVDVEVGFPFARNFLIQRLPPLCNGCSVVMCLVSARLARVYWPLRNPHIFSVGASNAGRCWDEQLF